MVCRKVRGLHRCALPMLLISVPLGDTLERGECFKGLSAVNRCPVNSDPPLLCTATCILMSVIQKWARYYPRRMPRRTYFLFMAYRGTDTRAKWAVRTTRHPIRQCRMRHQAHLCLSRAVISVARRREVSSVLHQAVILRLGPQGISPN